MTMSCARGVWVDDDSGKSVGDLTVLFFFGSASLLCLWIVVVVAILFFLLYNRRIQLVQSTPCFFIYVGKGC